VNIKLLLDFLFFQGEHKLTKEKSGEYFNNFMVDLPHMTYPEEDCKLELVKFFFENCDFIKPYKLIDEETDLRVIVEDIQWNVHVENNKGKCHVSTEQNELTVSVNDNSGNCNVSEEENEWIDDDEKNETVNDTVVIEVVDDENIDTPVAEVVDNENIDTVYVAEVVDGETSTHLLLKW